MISTSHSLAIRPLSLIGSMENSTQLALPIQLSTIWASFGAGFAMLFEVARPASNQRPNQSLEPTRIGGPPLAAQLQRLSVTSTMRTAAAILSLLAISFPSHSQELSGKYKVQGPCAYRDRSGTYKSCVVWNRLELKKNDEQGSYKFDLLTHMFATTQSSCEYNGTFISEHRNGRLWLARKMANETDKCHFELEVTDRKLILHVSHEREFSCKESCGHNGSLESVPFPRKKVRKW